jgi:hypothetical protein
MKHFKILVITLTTLIATTIMTERAYAGDDVGGCVPKVRGLITELSMGEVQLPANDDGLNEIWVKMNDDAWYAVDNRMNLNDVAGSSVLSMLQLAYVSSLTIEIYNHGTVCGTFSEIKFVH